MRNEISLNETRSARRTYKNQSLERALQILSAFTVDRTAMTLSEISKSANLAPPTAMRLCRTLLQYDFLSFDQQTKKYSPGLKLFELGGIVYSNFSLRKIVSPYLAKLQLKFGKTTFLGILHNDELLYIDKLENPNNYIRFASNVGTRRPPFFGMLGQLLMAYLPETEVDRILQKKPLVAFTKRSITDVATFKERLKKIREEGFFIDQEEAIDGITGISAPIRDLNGNVIAAIGVGFISSSVSEDEKKIIVKELVAVAEEISRKLCACGGKGKMGTREQYEMYEKG
ncbi:MAG: IclR family transcriptional regulator [candidate division WOR-3 bacterium]